MGHYNWRQVLFRMYNPGPADMEFDYEVDFDLLAKKEGESNIPVGRYEHFVNDSDSKDLLNSTENKNTRKNTNTFNDWRSARMTMTGNKFRIFCPFSAFSWWEEFLWEKGLLCNSTGESMLNTLFFYICKLFGLRAVDEHKTLSIDQFELGQDQKCKFINFTEQAYKTYKCFKIKFTNN